MTTRKVWDTTIGTGDGYRITSVVSIGPTIRSSSLAGPSGDELRPRDTSVTTSTLSAIRSSAAGAPVETRRTATMLALGPLVPMGNSTAGADAGAGVTPRAGGTER